MPGLTAQNLTTHGEAHAPKNHCNYGWGGRSKGAQQTLEPTAKPQEQREGISSTPHGGGTQVSQAWLNRWRLHTVSGRVANMHCCEHDMHRCEHHLTNSTPRTSTLPPASGASAVQGTSL